MKESRRFFVAGVAVRYGGKVAAAMLHSSEALRVGIAMPVRED
jgi:hypothetical protein